MDIAFVLVQPTTPENIGAAARALCCTGFSDLRLVSPCSHLQSRARWMATHAEDILQSAQVYVDFEDALHDIDVVIGTTARLRKGHREYLSPGGIREALGRTCKSGSRAAIVFGTESRGLTNQELERCDLLTTVPTRRDGASLNLAQAVMVYAYELSAAGVDCKEVEERKAGGAESPVLRSQVIELLDALSLSGEQALESRITERLALLGDRDLRLVHFLRKAVVEQLKKQR